jgi:hypothetical protein
VLVGQAVEAFDRRMQQLGVGREADVLGLHRGVDRDPLKVLAGQCSRAPSAGSPPAAALPVAEPLPPMAQVGARVPQPSARSQLRAAPSKLYFFLFSQSE